MEKANKIISMSLKETDIQNIDKITKELELSGRSEAIRAGIRALDSELQTRLKFSGKVNAVLVIVHDHANNIAETAHRHQQIVVSHLHNHFHHKCVDVFILSGEGETIRKLAVSFEKNKKVKQVKLVIC